MHQTGFLCQDFGLCPFTDTGGTEEYDVSCHGYAFAFNVREEYPDSREASTRLRY